MYLSVYPTPFFDRLAVLVGVFSESARTHKMANITLQPTTMDPLPIKVPVCEPSKSEQAILLVDTTTESSTFQQVDLPGALRLSEEPGDEDGLGQV